MSQASSTVLVHVALHEQGAHLWVQTAGDERLRRAREIVRRSFAGIVSAP
ncbi:MAG: hypothetical protein V9E94_04295 [Microthrixaceae bacterium]